MKLEWDEVEQHVKLTGQVFAMDFILFYFFFFKNNDSINSLSPKQNVHTFAPS